MLCKILHVLNMLESLLLSILPLPRENEAEKLINAERVCSDGFLFAIGNYKSSNVMRMLYMCTSQTSSYREMDALSGFRDNVKRII